MEQTIFTHIKEYPELFWLRLLSAKRNFVEYCKVVFRYYSNADFRKQDLYLLSQYIFQNPFKVSKRYLIDKDAQDPDLYGETPLTTLEGIANECRLKSSDVVFEMGSGRGRACFWMNSIIGCRVIGIEQIPEFVEKATKVIQYFDLKGIEFRQGDILEADLSGATVIYLYGTCLEDHFIQKLAKKFAKLPSGTKIITVSYPLTDYTDEPVFEVMKRFPAQFTWGEGDVYLHLRK